MKASPSARWHRAWERSFSLAVLGAVILEPSAADRGDYLELEAARWGRLLWTNTEPAAIVRTPSGYALAGVTAQAATGRAGFVATVDPEGTLRDWAVAPHEPVFLAGFSVGDLALTRDATGAPDGFVVVGSVPKEYADGLKEWAADSLWVWRTDLGLVTQWEYKGADGYAHIGTGVVARDGGFWVGAATWNGVWLAPPMDEFDYIGGEGQLTRLSATGEVEWTRGGFGEAADLPTAPIWHLTGAGEERFMVGTRQGMALLDEAGEIGWTGGEPLPYVAVRPTADGGAVGVANRLENPGEPDPLRVRKDIVLTRLDAAGESVWSVPFGAPGVSDAARDLLVLEDGGCLILGHTGTTEEHGGGMWLIRTDGEGNNRWDIVLPGAGAAVTETPDGDFLVAGRAVVEETQHLWLVKIRGDLQAPVPGFSFHPDADLFVGDEVTFDAGSSTAPGSTLTAYAWDFGNEEQAEGPIVRHTYQVPGTYRVRLTVTNREGIRRAIEREVTVNAPAMQWERIYGEYWQDALFAVAPAADGGFVLAGGTYSHGGQNSFRMWLLKTDGRGRPIWERYLNDPEGRPGTATAIVPAPEGGHVVAGYRSTTLFETYLDGWILKVDEAGEIEWQHLFVGDRTDQIWGLAAVPGGRFVLTGRSESFCPVDGDVWWAHWDPMALEATSQIVTVAPPYARSGSSIAGTPEGGILLGTGGQWLYENYNPYDLSSGYFSVTKTGADGEVEWNTLLGLAHQQACTTWVAPTPDGGAYAAGTLNGDVCLVGLDASGVPVWTNSWGMARRAEWGYGGTLTRNGDAVVVGSLNWPLEGWKSDLMVTRVDAAGNELWLRTFGQPELEEAGKAVLELDDGSLVILGRRPLSRTDYRPWLFKLAANRTPTATGTCLTLEPRSGAPVAFAVTEAQDPDGSIAGYEWDFGDGHFGEGPSPTHVYAAAGTYPVVLHAIDNDGGEGVTTLALVVEPGIEPLRPGVAVGAHEIIENPGERPDLFEPGTGPPGVDWEGARAFSLAATGPDGPCGFRIHFAGPLPPDATLYKLPEWVEIPYVRVDAHTIEVELAIVRGELDPLFVLASTAPIEVIESVALGEDRGLRLTFPTRAATVYGVERTAVLAPSTWTPVPFAITPGGPGTHTGWEGTGEPATVYLEAPEAGQAFYRLRGEASDAP